MEIIRSFEQLSKNDSDTAGGKGASLGEMTQAGIPVPPGYVILSSAFDIFLDKTNLRQEIDLILRSVDIKDIKTTEMASKNIQKMILSADIPTEISFEISKFQNKLNSKYVAVRSSATAEDSASAAWAGQLESYLNTTDNILFENVKKCWASLFSPRAIFYRFEQNLQNKKISVAVVVQKMIESEKAGIAFSVHPVTQNPDQLIIEAGFGLGEAVVSGQITPDSYVVNKRSKQIIEKNVQTQTTGLFRAKRGGNEWQRIQDDRGNLQTLSDQDIIELSEIIIKIENHYKFPCDIEWAIANNIFYIVQSRPITTIAKDKISSLKIGIPAQWENSFILGNQDVDTSFLTLEMIWDGMRSKLVADQAGIPLPDLFVEIIKGKTINTFVSATEINQFVKKAAETLKTNPQLLKNLKDNTIKTAKDIRDFADFNIKSIDSYDAKKLASTLLEIKKLQSICVAFGTLAAWADITGEISQKTIEIVNKRKNLKHPKHWYSHVLSTPEVLSLTEQAKTDIKHSKLTDAELLKKYYWLDQGYIGTGLTSSQLHTIKKVKDNNDVINVSADNLKSELNLTLAEWRYFRISQDIIYMKTLRADSRQYLNVLTNLIAKKLGQFWQLDPELVSVMSADEIYKIIHNDLKIPVNLSDRFLHSIILLTKSSNYTSYTKQDISQLLGKLLKRENSMSSDIIHGQTAYQGLVRGKIKLVFGPQHNEKVSDGDILVSTATSPQLLPAMIRASAFVTDVGGVTSHAAIVARELKKPCIVGTKYATQILKDGDSVEVDADNAVIRIFK